MLFNINRQPVFNKKQKVYGYHVSLHPGMTKSKGKKYFESQAEVNIQSLGLSSQHLELVSNNRRVFIQFPRKSLLNGEIKNYPRELLVVDIPEDTNVDDEVKLACKNLKAKGYLISLDNFKFQPNLMHLTDYGHIVKVDDKMANDTLKKSILEELHPKGIKCLVKNLDTPESYKKALDLGYNLFHGEFFRKPILTEGKRIKGYKQNYLRILKEIYDSQVDFDKMENIVKQDVSLAYELLKLINSAAFGFRSEIRSIKQALVLLGINEIRKWASVVVLNNMVTDKPEELVKLSLFRARFCELLAKETDMRNRASDLFLLGMFSLIDAFVDIPMPKVMENLPLAGEIKRALTGNESAYRDLYKLVVNYEKGYWQEVTNLLDLLQMDEPILQKTFLESLAWVNRIFNLN